MILAESYYIDHMVYPVQQGELECSTSEDVTLYYFNLGGDDYQIVSFHDEGQTAYLTSSETVDVDEYDRYDIEQETWKNYGEPCLSVKVFLPSQLLLTWFVLSFI